jgi:SAM-dependent methyltransferase
METGEREISLLFHEISSLNLVVARGAAVDFGCGVGRLTQALARRFGSVLGLDVSPEMIRLARQVNKYGSRVRYETNDGPLLRVLPEASVDFVYSVLVLQHVPPEVSSEYIADLVKSLRRGGLFVFQLPSTRAEARRGPVAMPESAYQAALTLSRPVPRQIDAESSIQVALEIVNVSGVAWSQADAGALRAGNHWLDAQAAMVVQDDGRASLPQTLGPNDRCRIGLEVRAPAHPGNYLLELDVVHEGITWFADRGSRAIRVPIDVVRGAKAEAPARFEAGSGPLVLPDYSDLSLTHLLPAPDGAAAVADFPMHAIPRETVERVVTGAGGEIVHVVDDDHAKPEWKGYKYFVMKEMKGVKIMKKSSSS